MSDKVVEESEELTAVETLINKWSSERKINSEKKSEIQEDLEGLVSDAYWAGHAQGMEDAEEDAFESGYEQGYSDAEDDIESSGNTEDVDG